MVSTAAATTSQVDDYLAKHPNRGMPYGFPPLSESDFEIVSAWLKKDDDPDFQQLSDPELASFLNGLIIDKRGRKDGPLPEPEKQLNNNVIFNKLKIAFNLRAEDTLAILALNDYTLSNHELSAFFRKPGHKHFKACKDQVLRNFLKGLQLKYRPEKSAASS